MEGKSLEGNDDTNERSTQQLLRFWQLEHGKNMELAKLHPGMRHSQSDAWVHQIMGPCIYTAPADSGKGYDQKVYIHSGSDALCKR